ncbi:hypothetical protein CsSME_00034572 [Camellia sinensis var. sinensis]
MKLNISGCCRIEAQGTQGSSGKSTGEGKWKRLGHWFFFVFFERRLDHCLPGPSPAGITLLPAVLCLIGSVFTLVRLKDPIKSEALLMEASNQFFQLLQLSFDELALTRSTDLLNRVQATQALMPKLFDSDQIQLKSVAASLAGASQAFQDTVTQDNLLSSEEAHLEAQLAQVGIKRTLKQEQSTIKANMQNLLLTQAENAAKQRSVL